MSPELRVVLCGVLVLSCARRDPPGRDHKSDVPLSDLLVLFDNRPENSVVEPRKEVRNERWCPWKEDPIQRAVRFLEDLGREDRLVRRAHARVRLLWREEDRTEDLYRWDRPDLSHGASGDRVESRRWHGSLADFAATLTRCDRAAWVRGNSHEGGILENALSLLNEWRSNDCVTREESSRQVIVIVLTGPWTNELFSEDDTLRFLDGLKTIAPSCLRTVLVIPKKDRKSLPGPYSDCEENGIESCKKKMNDCMNVTALGRANGRNMERHKRRAERCKNDVESFLDAIPGSPRIPPAVVWVPPLRKVPQPKFQIKEDDADVKHACAILEWAGLLDGKRFRFWKLLDSTGDEETKRH